MCVGGGGELLLSSQCQSKPSPPRKECLRKKNWRYQISLGGSHKELIILVLRRDTLECPD